LSDGYAHPLVRSLIRRNHVVVAGAPLAWITPECRVRPRGSGPVVSSSPCEDGGPHVATTHLRRTFRRRRGHACGSI